MPCFCVQSANGATVAVSDVKKAAGGQLFIHKAEVATGIIKTGDTVAATIDRSFRRWVRANHTATHLLQAALKKVLGDDVSQQGSLVHHDGFRFDFSLPRPMTLEEIAGTEALLNCWIEVCSPSVEPDGCACSHPGLMPAAPPMDSGYPSNEIGCHVKESHPQNTSTVIPG
jgi:alanyl-tRNA synthetase